MNLETLIIASPNTTVSLEKEMRLIKSGLLYSDSITLVSPTLTSIIALMQMANLNEKEKLEFIKILAESDPSLKGDEIQNAVQIKETLERKRGKSKEEIVQLEKIKIHLKNLFRQFEIWGETLFMNSGLPEFNHLITDGTIKLKHIDVNESKKNMGLQMLDETVEALSNREVYPIFDSIIEDLANAYLRENPAVNDWSNINEVFIGKEFLLRLPNIDSISFSQIALMKQELSLELSKFKNLINNYSSEINGVSFTEHNRQIIEKKYRYDFLPQIQELQKTIDSNGVFKHIFKDMTENLTKYSIFLGVTGISDMERLLIGAGGMAVGESLLKGFNEMKKTRIESKNSSVYFYHKLMNA